MRFPDVCIYTRRKIPRINLHEPLLSSAFRSRARVSLPTPGLYPKNIRLEHAAVPKDARRPYRTLIQDAQRLSVDFRFRTGKSDLDNKALVDLERMVRFFNDFRCRSEGILLLGFADNTGVFADPICNCRLNGQGRSERNSNGED